ncbi:hypothetical protein [Micavibrio aeruginosavorus]|uniref:Uncharacterized protein n=1 Tax=Micavibrio aeruginosavorus (strain ARL-13) TaxID=856793 RepID=G2KN00_MICAA|nr:hypothetical protein [Micavibrio aeruginosavorus]AEP08932.1 hypothetical protein MICA_595 [Micavibrio aeruginosavorus ARL-13]
MCEQEQQFEQQYFEQMQLEQELDQAASFLMSHGFLVIPREDIAKFMGRYSIVPLPDNNIVNEDEIPF